MQPDPKPKVLRGWKAKLAALGLAICVLFFGGLVDLLLGELIAGNAVVILITLGSVYVFVLFVLPARRRKEEAARAKASALQAGPAEIEPQAADLSVTKPNAGETSGPASSLLRRTTRPPF